MIEREPARPAPAKSLAQLEETYKKAQESFLNADTGYKEASKRRTDALNWLNAAQKSLSDAVADLKAQAPRDTDWAREKNSQREIAG